MMETIARKIAEWSEITGMGQSAIWRRIKLGWNTEDILTKPLRKTTIVYNGEEKSLAEWSRITGLNDGAISRRLTRGWDVEKR